MAKDDLTLEVGDVMQLQFIAEDSSIRHYAKIIGYLPEQSLIVTTPKHAGKVMLVREGQRVSVRLLSGSQVIAFTVNVLRSSVKPYPYLHLSYPNELQSITVRKAQRVNLDLRAKVKLIIPGNDTEEEPKNIEVCVEDMSTTGALLISDQTIGEAKQLLAMQMEMDVADAVESINLVSIIRNARIRKKEGEETKHLTGIEFQFADRQESILLHAFVYEMLAKHHNM